MYRHSLIFICLALVLCLGAPASAQNGRRSITVVYEETQGHIPDFTLNERLNNALTMDEGLQVLMPAEDSTLPPAPNNRFDMDRLLEWGREIGCRYIIYLQIDARKVETRKKRSIPFVLNRYVVEGRIYGTYSLIDLNRTKVVGTWTLKAKKGGPRQWQVGENYPDDPDLQLSAPRKLDFYRELEDLAVTEIVTEISRHSRGR